MPGRGRRQQQADGIAVLRRFVPLVVGIERGDIDAAVARGGLFGDRIDALRRFGPLGPGIDRQKRRTRDRATAQCQGCDNSKNRV
jgi:hypothetical protein